MGEPQRISQSGQVAGTAEVSRETTAAQTAQFRTLADADNRQGRILRSLERAAPSLLQNADVMQAVLDSQWETFMQFARSWSDSMAANAKADREASQRSQLQRRQIEVAVAAARNLQDDEGSRRVASQAKPEVRDGVVARPNSSVRWAMPAIQARVTPPPPKQVS